MTERFGGEIDISFSRETGEARESVQQRNAGRMSFENGLSRGWLLKWTKSLGRDR